MTDKKLIMERIRREISTHLSRYPEKRAVLLPALHAVQHERGWISQDSMEEIADMLNIHPIDVKQVVSFYTMFNMKPVGKYHIQICTNLSCSLLESRHLLAVVEEKLQIKSGETTADQKISLSTVECLGYCGTAPVMMINDELVDELTEAKIDRLLNELD